MHHFLFLALIILGTLGALFMVALSMFDYLDNKYGIGNNFLFRWYWNYRLNYLDIQLNRIDDVISGADSISERVRGQREVLLGVLNDIDNYVIVGGLPSENMLNEYLNAHRRITANAFELVQMAADAAGSNINLLDFFNRSNVADTLRNKHRDFTRLHHNTLTNFQEVKMLSQRKAAEKELKAKVDWFWRDNLSFLVDSPYQVLFNVIAELWVTECYDQTESILLHLDYDAMPVPYIRQLISQIHKSLVKLDQWNLIIDRIIHSLEKGAFLENEIALFRILKHATTTPEMEAS